MYEMNDSLQVETMLSLVTEPAKKILSDLLDCWKDMYQLDEAKADGLVSKFSSYINDLLNDMLDSQKQKIITIKKGISQLKEEKTNLEMMLNVRISIDENDCLTKPLTLQKQYLENQLRCYREQRDMIVKEMETLKSELESLSLELNIAMPTFDKPVPSKDDLINIRTEIMNLREIKNFRIDSIRTTKGKIFSVLRDLELTADLVDWDLETKSVLVSDDEDDWLLFVRNIQLMQDKLSELQVKLEGSKKEKEALLPRLEHLWAKIQLDDNSRNEFLMKNNLFGKPTLARLNKEMIRCQEVMRSQLQPLTEKKRLEIKLMWDKLTYAPQQTDSFQLYFDNDFTEELLDNHELYLTQLKTYFTKYQDLFNMMREWKELWTSWVDLETRALDKNRFNNRGGRLLKEEKERKLLERNLPRLKNDIMAKVKNHLDTEGKPFLWHGSDPCEIIASDHRQLDTLLGQQKSAKKKEQQKSSSLQRCGASSASKRKLLLTPDCKVNKFPKSTIYVPRGQPLLNQTITLSKGVNSLEFLTPPPASNRHAAVHQDEDTDEAAVSCDDFQTELTPGTSRRPLETLNVCSSSPAGVILSKLRTTPSSPRKLTALSKPSTPEQSTRSPVPNYFV